jgi:hypothetical protein
MQKSLNIQILAKNFKCLSSEFQGYNIIKPINLIIGRNNSGKSTLIDLIQYTAANDENYKALGHRGLQPEIVIFGTDILGETEAKAVFPDNYSGGDIGMNHWEFGRRFIGRKLSWKMSIPGEATFVSIDHPDQQKIPHGHRLSLVRRKENPFRAKVFVRLSSDRDLRPEGDSAIGLFPNGQGATNLIRQFLTRASYPTKQLRLTLLNELNKIFNPDSNFSDITVQQLQDDKWEVFLDEKDKGLIALSQSGSGLKTVLLVLLNLYFIPHHHKKDLSRYAYGFEELENNLHPALQRRLLLYLRNIAIDKNCIFFLTTHSSVVIDLFSKDENAQIIHIRNNGEASSIVNAINYMDHKSILDDLDVRASDLLQSNGIVWVEGPSDRLYFKKWVEIWSDGKLAEGVHYRCVFYGGRLLAHLSAESPDAQTDDLVRILDINRNAVLLMDSDREKEDDKINSTKQRLDSGFKRIEGISWITYGREIENYIPIEALRARHSNQSLNAPGIFQRFSEYLKGLDPIEERRFLKDKVTYAEEISTHFNKENLSATLDLKTRLDDICARIRGWNGLS